LARENYSYKKFQRELAQKKKREEKLKRKQDKKNPEGNAGVVPSDAQGEASATEPQSSGADI
jgi:hypothetical protein